ncbi:MAG: 16S rRNA (uracil(1498)-N(3))-methyltransferase [Ruminococcaceae bacterium]|nr:16S rRNA (uracil(1498)-N(3))-methyltransferase [Oscillospiraceae bacterium]
MPKFFLPNELFGEELVTFDGQTARHVAYSLRMAVGDSITLCDMSGNKYDCIIESFTKESVTVRVLSSGVAQGEPPCKIVLFQALAKGEKMDLIVQKATELGVCEIVPFESRNCIVKSDKKGDVAKAERRRKIAADAAGQCGRGRIPNISETLTFKQALEKLAACETAFVCYEGEGTLPLKELLPDRVPETLGFMIGPEGGFDKSEIAMAKQLGVSLAGLGERILRTETASLFVLSALSFHYEG